MDTILMRYNQMASEGDVNKGHESISFPLEVFPSAIREIIATLNEYENLNLDFTAASFFTVFAAAMGNAWSVRFNTSWVSRPIIYMVLVSAPSCGKTHLSNSPSVLSWRLTGNMTRSIAGQ